MMEGLIHTVCEAFYQITYAASVLQHVLRNLSLWKRISHLTVDVTETEKPHSRIRESAGLTLRFPGQHFLVCASYRGKFDPRES